MKLPLVLSGKLSNGKILCSNIKLTLLKIKIRMGMQAKTSNISRPLYLSGASFQTGKTNVTVRSPGLSSCRAVRFSSSFSGGGSVKVFTSVGHAVQAEKPRDGATTWVESVTNSGFKACVLEFGRGSNGSTDVNWLASQTAPQGVQHESVSYDLWTTGTNCKRVDFPKVGQGWYGLLCFYLSKKRKIHKMFWKRYNSVC